MWLHVPSTSHPCARGGGGLDLAVHAALRRLGCAPRTVVHVEREAYAAAVLAARMAEGALDAAPIWSDLTTFDARRWRGCVDLVLAGFPCQPASVAGKRGGTDDARWLWPAVARCVEGVRPWGVFVENVPGLLTVGGRPDLFADGWALEPATDESDGLVRGGAFAEVLADLAALGFDAEWMRLAADDPAVGATQERERIFLLAHARRGAAERRGVTGVVRGATAAAGRAGDQRQRRGGAARGAGQAVADPDEQHVDDRRLGAGPLCGERPEEAVLPGGEKLADPEGERVDLRGGPEREPLPLAPAPRPSVADAEHVVRDQRGGEPERGALGRAAAEWDGASVADPASHRRRQGERTIGDAGGRADAAGDGPADVGDPDGAGLEGQRGAIRDVTGNAGGGGGGGETCRSSAPLADAARVGEREPDDAPPAERGGGARPDAGGRGGDVACARGGGRPGPEPEVGGELGAARSGGAAQADGVEGCRRACRRAPWPPGPEDADGWALYLDAYPDLPPAVEPEVRGGADGVADRMGSTRAHELRLLGNGVVPDQAEVAFHALVERMRGA